MKGAGSLALLAVVVALAAGCGGSSKPATGLPTDVQLQVGTKSTGGKALVFTAKADKKLASRKGALYAMQLRGIGAAAHGIATSASPQLAFPAATSRGTSRRNRMAS